jgi:peptide/nickel transport system substrate-binding protein
MTILTCVVRIVMAVDNREILDIAVGGLGLIGENHHVCPIHPEYAELPPLERDAEAAMAMLEAAGFADETLELISIDTDWQRDTCNAIAAQLRDAGMMVERTVLPGATFWNGWTDYPFSATEWGPRPLGVQVLALAYKSGVPWNESGSPTPSSTRFSTRRLVWRMPMPGGRSWPTSSRSCRMRA